MSDLNLIAVLINVILIFSTFYLDLINSATGTGEKEKKWALEILHTFIAMKKKVSTWSKNYEVLMKRHLELCIDLKNPHFAKDGLHQYRNLCQVVSNRH